MCGFREGYTLKDGNSQWRMKDLKKGGGTGFWILGVNFSQFRSTHDSIKLKIADLQLLTTQFRIIAYQINNLLAKHLYMKHIRMSRKSQIDGEIANQ